MNQIETASFTLEADQPCYGLSVFEDATGFCSRLVVLRGGQPVGVVIHHGPNEEYSGKIPPMFIPSTEGENPVGLMLEMSERHRHDLRWFKKAEEMKQSSTLIKDVIRQDEMARLAIKNQSVFGPAITKQRNGHDSTQVKRDWWAERSRRTGQTKHYREMRIRP